MTAEGALEVHGSENPIGRAAPAAAAEARLFLSTRLVRELVAADALGDAEGDDRPALASRLLDVIRAGLRLPMAGIVDAERLSCLAAFEIPEAVRAVLEGRVSGGSAGTLPVVRRALEEHRVFLVGRTSRDPLMVVLRDARPELEAVAVVPLHDRDLPSGVLVLGASDDSIVNAATLRTLSIAFRLVALLLSPARGAQSASTAGTGEAERYLVEMEELERRLAEANELVQRSSEQASSEVAALRAEVEAGRARIAELEAAVAGERNESDLRRDVESECSRLRSELHERSEGARALEEECAALRSRVDALERACDAARERASELERQIRDGLPEEEPEPGTLELEPTNEPLGAFLERAAAAAAGEADTEPDAEPEVVSLDATESAVTVEAEAMPATESGGIARSVWHVESSGDVRQAVDEVAQAHNVPVWRNEGERPRADAEIALVNLLDPALAADPSILDPADGRSHWLYGFAPESGLGFDLGSVCCLPRPVDPAAVLARLQGHVGRKLTGLVLVSAQLRELAGVRAALAEVDAAGSVACDTRQALDLLEIVRRPDALLIDLALAGGQGLALAHQLRRSPETGDLPILFLLPAGGDLEPLRAAAERAGILGPYGPTDVRRLVTGALSTRR